MRGKGLWICGQIEFNSKETKIRVLDPNEEGKNCGETIDCSEEEEGKKKLLEINGIEKDAIIFYLTGNLLFPAGKYKETVSHGF